MRKIIIGGALALSIAVLVLSIASRRTPAPPEDRSDELMFSDSCWAEIKEGYRKFADYAIANGRSPPDGQFDPPCQKQETDAWIFKACLKTHDGDGDRCRAIMKAL